MRVGALVVARGRSYIPDIPPGTRGVVSHHYGDKWWIVDFQVRSETVSRTVIVPFEIEEVHPLEQLAEILEDDQ